MWLLRSSALIFLLVTRIASAQILETRESLKESSVSVAFEYSQLSFDAGSVETQGFNIKYDYPFRPGVYIEGSFNSGFSGDLAALESAYLGVSAYGLYAIWGNCCRGERQLIMDSKTVLIERYNRAFMVLLGAGLEQLLLSGSESVYSTSGIGLQASVFFIVWGQNIRINIKTAQLNAAGNNVNTVFTSGGVYFPF